MAAKFFLVLCASALFVQAMSLSCYNYDNAAAWNTANLVGAEIAGAEIGASVGATVGSEIAAANNIGYGCSAPSYAASPAIYTGPMQDNNAWNAASLVGAEIAGAEIGATIGATVGSEIAAANNIGYGYSAPSYTTYAPAPAIYTGPMQANNAWNAANIAGAEFAAFNNFAAPAYTAAPAAIYTGPAIASSNGGSFGVSVFSPIAPNGVKVFSENSIEGFLDVIGSLPLLAAVGFEDTVPSSGAAGTSYSCGSGSVGISSESIVAAGLGAGRASANQFTSAGAGYNAANAGIINAELAGFNAGLAGARLPRPTCSCGSY